MFEPDAPIDSQALAFCIGAALTHHRDKTTRQRRVSLMLQYTLAASDLC
jgi:hypothetical protein